MKLSNNELQCLMTKHIFQLSEEEIKALAFILDIKISHFKKSDRQIEFKMTQKKSTVIVECFENYNCSIGREKKGRGGKSGLISWGGCFSFACTISIFRNFFIHVYELILYSPEKLKVYEKSELEEIFLLANDLVESA